MPNNVPREPTYEGRRKPRPNLEMCNNVLSGIQEQIRFADSKAGFLAALNTLLFGFVVVGCDRCAAISVNDDARTIAFWLTTVLLTLYVIASIAATVLVISSVMPRFGEQAPQCRLFFGHIAKHYGRDYGKYFRDTKDMTDADWAEELAGQIVEVSQVASVKHQRVRLAAFFTMVAVCLWVLSLGAMATMSVSKP
jgi:hypothetical protein